MGYQESKPCDCIFGPPMPAKWAPGMRFFNAAISVAPRKSPEVSPATMPINGPAPAVPPPLMQRSPDDASSAAIEEGQQRLQFRLAAGAAGKLVMRLFQRQ